MLDKIINTMFHGNIKSKIYLWAIFILIIAGFFLAVIGIVLNPMYLAGTFLAFGMDFILWKSINIETKKKNYSKKSIGTQHGKVKVKKKGGGESLNITKENLMNVMVESDHREDKEERKLARGKYLTSLDQKKFKKIMKANKVKQKHVFVMIDAYSKKKLEETPALLWRNSTYAFFLPLDGKSKEFHIPLNKIHGIYFEKNIPANPQEDYLIYTYPSFMTKLYAPFIPDYHETTKDGKIAYVKNLFYIEPGIYFTNTSVKNVMEVLEGAPFLVDDEIANSELFDEYFKIIYRASILCKNHVITLEEYRKEMEETLEAFLIAPVTGREFVKTLRDLNRFHLITTEYLTKYAQLFPSKNPGMKQ